MSTFRKSYKNQLKRFNNSHSNSSSTSVELTNLVEMFPDWEADELQGLLSENDNSLEIVIDLIVNNKVSKWEPIKKEKHKKKEKETEDHNSSTNGSTNSASTSSTAPSSDRKPYNKSKPQSSSTRPPKKQHANANYKKGGENLPKNQSQLLLHHLLPPLLYKKKLLLLPILGLLLCLMINQRNQ